MIPQCGFDGVAVTEIYVDELDGSAMLEPAKIGVGPRSGQVIENDDLIASTEVSTRRVDTDESCPPVISTFIEDRRAPLFKIKRAELRDKCRRFAPRFRSN